MKTHLTLILGTLTLGILIMGTSIHSAYSGIFGNDDRIETQQVKDPAIQKLVQGTVLLVQDEKLEPTSDGGFQIKKSQTLKEFAKLCKNQRFGNQLSLGFCSGSLVAPNLILSAGHCMPSQEWCEKTQFVFGFQTDSQNPQGPSRFGHDQVYRCKKLVSSHQNGFSSGGLVLGPQGLDFSLIELDREVQGREPLTLSEKSELKAKDHIFTIGHPTGIPSKIASGEVIRQFPKIPFQRGETVFSAELDAFGGNSGGPAFSRKSMKIEGVLVRAKGGDFEESAAKCNVLSRMKSGTVNDAVEFTRPEAIVRDIQKWQKTK